MRTSMVSRFQGQGILWGPPAYWEAARHFLRKMYCIEVCRRSESNLNEQQAECESILRDFPACLLVARPFAMLPVRICSSMRLMLKQKATEMAVGHGHSADPLWCSR